MSIFIFLLGCGPAPGHYNVKNQENGPGGVKFESSTERFKEAPVLPGGNQKLHVRKCSISSDDSTVSDYTSIFDRFCIAFCTLG